MSPPGAGGRGHDSSSFNLHTLGAKGSNESQDKNYQHLSTAGADYRVEGVYDRIRRHPKALSSYGIRGAYHIFYATRGGTNLCFLAMEIDIFHTGI